MRYLPGFRMLSTKRHSRDRVPDCRTEKTSGMVVNMHDSNSSMRCVGSGFWDLLSLGVRYFSNETLLRLLMWILGPCSCSTLPNYLPNLKPIYTLNRHPSTWAKPLLRPARSLYDNQKKELLESYYRQLQESSGRKRSERILRLHLLPRTSWTALYTPNHRGLRPAVFSNAR